jgi:short-subunit dehydrogenase
MLARAVEANAQLARLPQALIGDVGEVAAEGYRACMAGEVICVPGAVNRVATLAARAAPKWLLRRVAGALGRSAM